MGFTQRVRVTRECFILRVRGHQGGFHTEGKGSPGWFHIEGRGHQGGFHIEGKESPGWISHRGQGGTRVDFTQRVRGHQDGFYNG